MRKRVSIKQISIVGGNSNKSFNNVLVDKGGGYIVTKVGSYIIAKP